jgi:hypothetical protein
MATDKELSDFLENVERRAFKQAVYAVRKDEVALDIVQDAMIKLAEKYGDKPANELPLLFQRILQTPSMIFSVGKKYAPLGSACFPALAATTRTRKTSTCSKATKPKKAPRPRNPAQTKLNANKRSP